jgi:transcriptional regulator with XRE-family HTH domain
MLKNVHFTANQIKFIEWLACGKYSRSPSTQQEFADQIGVTTQTLGRWKRGQNGFTKTDFWDAVTARARELTHQHLSTVYESLRAEAEKGSFQHQKLLLELSGEYVEQKKVELEGNVNVKVIKGVSLDDL